MCLCMLEKNGSHLIHLFKVLRKGTKFNLNEELRKIFQEV